MIERGRLDDLAAFASVARHRSFTRAAAELGLSTSNLSHIIRKLEGGLGVRLLNRNSRSVSPSEDGEALLRTLGPALEGVADALDAMQRGREAVRGTLRITATPEAFRLVLRPVLSALTRAHPDAVVEVSADYAFRDIVADQFDAGIRLGEKLEQDMIGVAVGPELRMAVVASPAYLAARPPPRFRATSSTTAASTIGWTPPGRSILGSSNATARNCRSAYPARSPSMRLS